MAEKNGSFDKDTESALKNYSDVDRRFTDPSSIDAGKMSGLSKGLSQVDTDRAKQKVKELNPSLTDAGVEAAKRAYNERNNVPSYKNGGVMKKAGAARLHRGEKARSGRKMSKGRSGGRC